MKNLKLMMITLMMSLFALVSFGQCKYEINEIDKFTKATKLLTKPEVLHKDFNSAISFQFGKTDTVFYVKIGINLTESVYTIREGDEMLLICNDNIIKLIAKETKIISGFAYINYTISSEDMAIISTNNITDIRIYLRNNQSDTYVEKSIDLKNSEKIKKLSNCIK